MYNIIVLVMQFGQLPCRDCRKQWL